MPTWLLRARHHADGDGNVGDELQYRVLAKTLSADADLDGAFSDVRGPGGDREIRLSDGHCVGDRLFAGARWDLARANLPSLAGRCVLGLGKWRGRTPTRWEKATRTKHDIEGQNNGRPWLAEARNIRNPDFGFAWPKIPTSVVALAPRNSVDIGFLGAVTKFRTIVGLLAFFSFASLVWVLGKVVQKSPSFRVQKANRH